MHDSKLDSVDSVDSHVSVITMETGLGLYSDTYLVTLFYRARYYAVEFPDEVHT